MVKPPSKAEEILGSLSAQVIATALPAGLAASAVEPSVPLVMAAAIFPALFNSLPAARQKQRLDAWRSEVAADLIKKEAKIQQLSDEQFHLINEVISTASQTIDPKKLAYLRSIICNSVDLSDLATQEAALLGRIVRDISGHEAEFVCQYSRYELVFIGKNGSPSLNSVRFEDKSEESWIVKGLMGLGVLDAVIEGNQGNFFGEGDYFTFSKLALALVTLLQTPEE